MTDPYDIVAQLRPRTRCLVCDAINGLPEEQRALWQQFSRDVTISCERVAMTFKNAGLTPTFVANTARNHRTYGH